MTIFLSNPDAKRPSRRVEKNRRVFGYLGLVVILLFGAAILKVRSFDDGPMPSNLAIAGRLPVTMPNGRRALLGDGIRQGLPTVITLWASWCGPCRSEAPKIAELRRQFGAKQLNLIYLNAREDGASPEDLARFVSSVGMAPDAYAIIDTEHLGDLTHDAQNLIPRTYVFDRSGNPTAMIVGYKPLALDRVAGLIGG